MEMFKTGSEFAVTFLRSTQLFWQSCFAVTCDAANHSINVTLFFRRSETVGWGSDVTGCALYNEDSSGVLDRRSRHICICHLDR